MSPLRPDAELHGAVKFSILLATKPRQIRPMGRICGRKGKGRPVTIALLAALLAAAMATGWWITKGTR